MHHSPSYLSREHMNPKFTCSQRQWLHSSVGRASHRYREVTGSSPVEVLNFFFRLLYAIAKIAIITARIILHLKNELCYHFNCLPSASCVGCVCWSSTLLRGFSSGTLVFPSHQETEFDLICNYISGPQVISLWLLCATLTK